MIATEPLRVLSLGAGVQSSAVLLMAAHGELDPIDHAIFADTGWEPPEVYEWLNGVLAPAADRAGIQLHIVRDEGGTIRERAHEMPLFVRFDDDGTGIIRRQCTSRFKIAPVRRKIRDLLDAGPRDRIAKGAVRQTFGISWDETQRMRDSDVAFIVNHYPLVDRRMSRFDCQRWILEHGYGPAPRSACIGCPFHADSEWLAMKRDRPEEFADACDLDDQLRAPDSSARRTGLRGVPYLHKKCIPLRDVTFAHENDVPLFDNECQGMCGV